MFAVTICYTMKHQRLVWYMWYQWYGVVERGTFCHLKPLTQTYRPAETRCKLLRKFLKLDTSPGCCDRQLSFSRLSFQGLLHLVALIFRDFALKIFEDLFLPGTGEFTSLHPALGKWDPWKS